MKTIKKVLAVSIVGLSIGLTTININAAGVSSNARTSYYSSITSTSNGQTLANNLYSLIGKNTSSVSYANLYTKAYPTTDVLPGTNIVWDIYSNEVYDLTTDTGSSASAEGVGFNREHTVPQSWFSKATPMVSDIFHVYPTDIYVNNQRSSYVYDDVKTASKTYKNGSMLGKGANFTSKTVFEVADEYKGDIARSYFYMAIRYKDKLANWTSGESQNIFQSSYPYLTTTAKKIFTKWSHEDPVSDKEMIRNDAIYSIQKNRNPFIDHPEYVDIIWTNSYSDTKTNTQYSLSSVNQAISSLSSSSSTDTVYSAYNKYCRLTVSDKEKVSNTSKLFSAVKNKSGNSLDLSSYWSSIISTYKNIYNSQSSGGSTPVVTQDVVTVTKSSFTSISGSLDSYISYKAAKGSASTSPAVNSGQIRVYQNGGTFTVSANNSKINSIELGSAMATKVSYTINGTKYEKSIAAGSKLVLSNLDLSSLVFTCIGTTKTQRLYVNYLKVTYTK